MIPSSKSVPPNSTQVRSIGCSRKAAATVSTPRAMNNRHVVDMDLPFLDVTASTG